VKEISTSMIDEALVRSILETGSFLGIKTVAGFIEDAETLAKLGEMGVDCVQGYLIGEPVALDSLA
jgi:EAL domain-containing protein (putative c-di-GMP-specific phosphodiesterase class I)